jgi:hypothetical protein
MGYFNTNARVVIKSGIQQFHHGETPHYSLAPVLTKLQRKRAYGIVRKRDDVTGSIGVQFPGMKTILWFKEYELTHLNGTRS